VPVCYRWSDGKTEKRSCFQLNTPAAVVPLGDGGSCPAWLTIDDNASGYYRSSYQRKTLDALLENGADRLKSQEQVKLLSDAQALSAAGMLDAPTTLRLAGRFGVGADRDVVRAAVRAVGMIGRLVPDDLQAEYNRFVHRSFGTRALELGWQPKPGEPDDLVPVRTALVPLVAIRGGDRELVQQARKLAEAWLADHHAVANDVAGTVLTTAGRYGDRTLFERYVEALRKEPEQSQRMRIAGALGAFPDPALVREALALLIPGTPKLDARELLPVITTQWPETRSETWKFVRENFDALNAKLPGARAVPFGATLPFVVTGFCDEAMASEVEAFFAPRLANLNGGPRNLASALESIRLCAAQKKALEPELRRFLSASQSSR
jgi:cytosol alanyl aminopeptidase